MSLVVIFLLLVCSIPMSSTTQNCESVTVGSTLPTVATTTFRNKPFLVSPWTIYTVQLERLFDRIDFERGSSCVRYIIICSSCNYTNSHGIAALTAFMIMVIVGSIRKSGHCMHFLMNSLCLIGVKSVFSCHVLKTAYLENALQIDFIWH